MRKLRFAAVPAALVLAMLLTVAALAAELPDSTTENTGETETVQTLASAAAVLREGLLERQTVIADALPDGIGWNEVFDAAAAHTGIPDEGDYLRLHVTAWSYSDGCFTATYSSTAEDEASAAAETDTLAAALAENCDSDYQRVLAVYRYLTENITFDETQSDRCSSAAGALCGGTANDRGFALAFYRLALTMGIDCRIVTSDIDAAWNLVRLGAKYYYLDASWDAQAGNTENPQFFLLGSENFFSRTAEVTRAYGAYITCGAVRAHTGGESRYADYAVSASDYTCAEGHSWDTGSTVTEPDCGNAGLLLRTCTACGETNTETLPATGLHSWVDGTVLVKATYNEEGLRTQTCSVCGDTQNTEIPKLDPAYCGENATWSLEDGVLTVCGTGATYDFSWYPNDEDANPLYAPWSGMVPGCESYGVGQIREVVIESGITRVGSEFLYCEDDDVVENGAVETITLPATVSSIGTMAFIRANITEIDLSHVQSMGIGVLCYCRRLTSVTLYPGLTKLYSYLFCGCSALENVELPENITYIGEQTFAGCTSLRSLTVPDSVKTIYARAFWDCPLLTELTMPAALTAIGSYAFTASGITELRFPQGLSYLAEDALAGMWKLKTVEFTGNAPTTFNTDAFLQVTAAVYYPAGNTTWTAAKREQYGGTLTWKTMDPATLARHISGIAPAEDAALLRTADLNGDGNIDSGDLYLLVKYLNT